VAGAAGDRVRLSYSGRLTPRLWRSGRLSAAALALALGCGGCSFSYQLESLFGKTETEPTGAITTAQALALPPESDLAYARAAAAELFNRGGKDLSLPWENPHSGARGTVTPVAAAYNQHGFVCHEFLASFVRERNEMWLQGEACRPNEGKWDVRSLKPWKRS
jgi:surface antigen